MFELFSARVNGAARVLGTALIMAILGEKFNSLSRVHRRYRQTTTCRNVHIFVILILDRVFS